MSRLKLGRVSARAPLTCFVSGHDFSHADTRATKVGALALANCTGETPQRASVRTIAFNAIFSLGLNSEGRARRERGSELKVPSFSRTPVPKYARTPPGPSAPLRPAHEPASAWRMQHRDRAGRLASRKSSASDRCHGQLSWPRSRRTSRSGAPHAAGSRPADLRPGCCRQRPTADPARRTGSGKWRSRAASANSC